MVAGSISMSQFAGGAAAVPHHAWMEARGAILGAFEAGEPLLLLLGPSGVGKSRLLREIEEALTPAASDIQRLESGEWVDPEKLPRALLVDEAGRMDDAMLEQLAQRREGFTLLAGLPAFEERLAALPHRVVRLGPLRSEDVPAYVTARMAATGLDGSRLADGTVPALAEAAGGLPSLLNLLVGTSFLMADMVASQQVTPAHVREAAALRDDMASLENSALPEADPIPPPLPPAEAAAPPPVQAAPVADTEPKAPEPAAQTPLSGRLALVALVLLVGGGLAWTVSQRAQEPSAAAPVLPMPSQAVEVAPTGTAVPDAPPAQAGSEAQGGAGSTAAAAPTEGLPSGAMVRVVITYPRGTAGAAERASALATELDGAGLTAGAPFPLSRPVAASGLSYFFLEDREAALRVQGLGGAKLAQAKPRLGAVEGALPRPGAIEVELAATDGALEEQPPAAEGPEAPAPEPAELAEPADEATLALNMAQRGILLSWRAAEAEPGCCFVEVVALGRGTTRAVFATYAEAPDQQSVRLSRPGRYAWRILTVSRAAKRYSASPWRHFTIGEAAQ